MFAFVTSPHLKLLEVVFSPASVEIYSYIDMFVINFLAPFQILLSPNFVSHTLDHSRQGDEILEGQGQGWWGRFALY